MLGGGSRRGYLLLLLLWEDWFRTLLGEEGALAR